MPLPLQIAAGSVVGRTHSLAGRNNQDAFAWRTGARGLVAAVADGCSSGAFTELGARVGVELFVQRVWLGLEKDPPRPADLLARAAEEVVAHLDQLTHLMGGARAERVESCFLFTLVGAFLLPEEGWLFSVGDGVVGINGQLRSLGPFAHNAPPYLGYRLLGARVPLRIEPLPLNGLQSLLLGTDGVLDLPDVASLVDDRVFTNRDMLRRRLTVVSRQTGRLLDDTTLVAIRRAPGEA
ncbi:MAG: protein phosphatase 2C domain-containing protein [Myxococcota bacterium]|nr:protein phosphatase 2C domain-containing protein [Myxococcota bacterium]